MMPLPNIFKWYFVNCQSLSSSLKSHHLTVYNRFLIRSKCRFINRLALCWIMFLFPISIIWFQNVTAATFSEMINSVAAVAFHHLAKSLFTCIPTRLLSHRSMLRIYVALSVLIYWVSVTFAWVFKFFNCILYNYISKELKFQFQPTLTAVLVNHTQTFDREYIDFNITPTSTGSHDVYINIRKSLPNVVSKVAVNFETKPNEYGYQFINKTFSTCKFYSSKKTEPLLQILYQVAVENPSVLLPRRCPIKSVG